MLANRATLKTRRRFWALCQGLILPFAFTQLVSNVPTQVSCPSSTLSASSSFNIPEDAHLLVSALCALTAGASAAASERSERSGRLDARGATRSLEIVPSNGTRDERQGRAVIDRQNLDN